MSISIQDLLAKYVADALYHMDVEDLEKLLSNKDEYARFKRFLGQLEKTIVKILDVKCGPVVKKPPERVEQK